MPLPNPPNPPIPDPSPHPSTGTEFHWKTHCWRETAGESFTSFALPGETAQERLEVRRQRGLDKHSSRPVKTNTMKTWDRDEVAPNGQK